MPSNPLLPSPAKLEPLTHTQQRVHAMEFAGYDGTRAMAMRIGLGEYVRPCAVTYLLGLKAL